MGVAFRWGRSGTTRHFIEMCQRLEDAHQDLELEGLLLHYIVGARRQISGWRSKEHQTRRLVEVALPVAWHLAGRARRRLLERMVNGRRQRWTFHAFVCFIVVEPVLAGLETSYDCVAARFGMSACVLARR